LGRQNSIPPCLASALDCVRRQSEDGSPIQPLLADVPSWSLPDQAPSFLFLTLLPRQDGRSSSMMCTKVNRNSPLHGRIWLTPHPKRVACFLPPPPTPPQLRAPPVSFSITRGMSARLAVGPVFPSPSHVSTFKMPLGGASRLFCCASVQLSGLIEFCKLFP